MERLWKLAAYYATKQLSTNTIRINTQSTLSDHTTIKLESNNKKIIKNIFEKYKTRPLSSFGSKALLWGTLFQVNNNRNLHVKTHGMQLKKYL